MDWSIHYRGKNKEKISELFLKKDKPFIDFLLNTKSFELHAYKILLI